MIAKLAPLRGQFSAKLAEISGVASGVKKFTLDAKLNFKPGQFIIIEIPGFPQRRAFSLCSAPGENIEFAAKIAGTFTQKLAALKTGEGVLVAGPFGNFVYDETRDAVFLAGGVGITPFRSMLLYALKSKSTKRITLLYSNKKEEDIAFRDDLSKLKEKASVVLTLTRESPEGWSGEKGRIDAEMLKKRVELGGDVVFYACGSPIFVSAMEQMLLEMKVPKDKIRTEKFFGVADA